MKTLNYLGPDTQRVPPSISLAASFPIVNGTNATVTEGQQLRLTALARDDVQVRNVEFYLDGAKTATDGNWPFEFHFSAPYIAAGKTSFTLQARASDTGGNFTWSDTITITLLPDQSPLAITSVLPARNAIVGAANTATAFFDRGLAPASINGATFGLSYFGTNNTPSPGSGTSVTNGSVTWQQGVNGAVLSFPTNLAPGLYRAVISAGVTDLRGDALGHTVTWDFYVLGWKDSDNDGLPDDIEIALGLNPTNSSTYGDGILDGNRVLDAYYDPKFGGLTVAWKLRYGYNPTNSSTFNDGIPDAERDPDFDGLNNAAEQHYATNPFNADTDGDGWDDATEILTGTDPLDPNSHPIIYAYAAAQPVSYLNAGTSQLPSNTVWSVTSLPASYLNALPASPPSNTLWTATSSPVSYLNALTAQPPSNTVRIASSPPVSYLNALTAAPPTNTLWTATSLPASYLNAQVAGGLTNLFLVSPTVSYQNNGGSLAVRK